ncbi:MAG: SAM-dependent methyltransferase [Prochlorococcus sp. SP3034]|nr:SAM-dependent methyltransferase [Prochlorococcus sp. SP3034]
MARESLTKIAYKTLQQGKSIAGLAHKEISSRIMNIISPDNKLNSFDLDKNLLLDIQNSMDILREEDWDDAENGIYPQKILFDEPWLRYLTQYPKVWLDMPNTWERRKKQNYNDLPNNIDKENYPNYYLRNFHHQTDGYLSDFSASIYDLQVEILFNGTADSMRRRILKPLKKGLSKFNTRKNSLVKILDVATGSGRTLKQLRAAFPKEKILGIDLSDSYLKEASRFISDCDGDLIELIKANAENLPFEDNSMQAITCVYLFHELPRTIREKVLKEFFRVLEPGGVLILADSIQLKDSPKFTSIMEGFYKNFHEPFYCDYIKDDLDIKMSEIGFKDIFNNSFFMTKVWSAIK